MIPSVQDGDRIRVTTRAIHAGMWKTLHASGAPDFSMPFEEVGYMNIRLTKSQVMDLFEIMGKKRKTNSELYEDLKDIIRLFPHVFPDKEFEITLSDNDLEMVRKLLTPEEKEPSGDGIFSEMKRGLKGRF